MLSRLSRKIMDSARRDRGYPTGLLKQLISIPSLSGDEGRVAGVVRQEMESLKPDQVFVDSIGNVVARYGSGRRVIVYDSHMDTVGVGDRAAWHLDPFAATEAGGVIFGRGASDNKAGLACMVAALKILVDLAHGGDFTLYIVGIVQEEECEGLALSVFLEENDVNPECVVIGECTNLGIARGHRGRAEIEVVTRGRSCHASAPERGENAIYKMTPIIESVRWLGDKLNEDAFLGKGTVTVTSIECSTPSRNAVPDQCRVYLDRRTVPADTRDSITREIDQIGRFAGAEVGLTTYAKPSYTGLARKRERFFPAWILGADAPALVRAARTYEMLFGGPARVGKWDFSTDGNYSMGVRSIPTVGFGPGEERYTHSTEDQVRVDDLWKASAFYALFPFVYSDQTGGMGGGA